MNEITASTRELIEKYVTWQNSLRPKEGTPTIHVDEVASRFASFYEKIRTIIDWKEEHLMRRAAIIRKLKRRFLDLEMGNFITQNVAELLVLELIRGGWFGNNTIEESKIKEVQSIIDKYVFIVKHNTGKNPSKNKGQAGLHFYNTMLEVAACEIEETLAPSIKEMALIDYMFGQMQERVKVSEGLYQTGLIKKEQTDTLLYIAVQQALFKFDDPIIHYNLLKYRHLSWGNPSPEELTQIAQNMPAMLREIEHELAMPAGRKFYTVCEKYDTPYLLLGDVITKNLSGQEGGAEPLLEKLQDPAFLESAVRGAFSRRLADLKVKIRRAAAYSTASIFITKILSLLILQLILAKIFTGGHVNFLSLAADIVIPTALMAVLVITIRPPSNRNMTLAIMEAFKIVYKKDTPEVYEIKASQKRGLATRLLLSLIYLSGAVVSFGAIYLVFNYLRFPASSIVINIIFIALILFAGTALRGRSEELTIESEGGGVFMFISDILLLPITGVGRWMSHKWKRYNAITTFFNALIDMPFSVFIEFLEKWRYFIKDKKEEMR